MTWLRSIQLRTIVSENRGHAPDFWQGKVHKKTPGAGPGGIVFRIDLAVRLFLGFFGFGFGFGLIALPLLEGGTQNITKRSP